MIKINLHGKWNFQLDDDKTGINDELFKKELNDTIILPTTTSEFVPVRKRKQTKENKA